MSDRIAVMKDGKVLQVGTPEEIYERPAARFVADFIGEANLLEAERAGARVARETATALGADHDWQALVSDIQHDEVHWCGMLMKAIRAMGATPSDQTGAFHGKAMAIAELHGASIKIGDAAGPGLCVEVAFPLLETGTDAT